MIGPTRQEDQHVGLFTDALGDAYFSLVENKLGHLAAEVCVDKKNSLALRQSRIMNSYSLSELHGSEPIRFGGHNRLV
jgi:hypothetical protein